MTAGRSRVERGRASPRSAARVVVFGCALVAVAGCRENPRASLGPPAVGVVAVTQQDVPVYREWIGNLDGFVNAQIRAQVTGYLLRQAYQEGSFVRKGDLLLRLTRAHSRRC
jgi:multidrug efflux pump subunit AcrA (membrane-fusion protein)